MQSIQKAYFLCVNVQIVMLYCHALSTCNFVEYLFLYNKKAIKVSGLSQRSEKISHLQVFLYYIIRI